MASSAINITEDGDELIIDIEFDPPLSKEDYERIKAGEADELPATHLAAIMAFIAIGRESK